MDTISSAEFRKRYAKLTQPTEVTVLGRLVGVWLPAGTVIESHKVSGTFNSKPFTPVPKSTKRR
jgi:hypothetical protein